MLLYHKATDILPETENRVMLPQPVEAINECYVRCITDFKSLEPSGIDKFVINMEIYQGDRLLGTVEQQGELAYNQKCVMLFSKLVGQ
jgi:hypothetical protein